MFSVSSTVLISTLLTLIPQVSVWAVQNALDVGTKLFSLGQHLVEFMLSQHGAERRLSKHVRGGKVVLDLNDGAFRIDDIEVEHCVNLHRDVVTRDHVLARYFDNLDAQIHSHHFLDKGDQQHKAGTFNLLKTPESEDHGSLIFTQDPHARREQNENKDRGEDQSKRSEIN